MLCPVIHVNLIMHRVMKHACTVAFPACVTAKPDTSHAKVDQLNELARNKLILVY